MAFCVYKITNSVNGMAYVGVTTRGIRRRFVVHKSDTDRLGHLPLYRAFAKHGIEAFTIDLIEECASLEDMKFREIHWIRELGCRAPNGYNVTDGGEACSGYKRPDVAERNRQRCKGVPLTEEHKRMAKANRPKMRHTPEAREKMSARLRASWKRGRPAITPETRAKLRESALRQWQRQKADA